MNVEVTVTAQDIAQGRPMMGDRCPVALAMQRACKRRDICVGTLTIVAGKRGVTIGRVPPRARAFIDAFDQGGSGFVSPISFKVRLALLRHKGGSK